MNSATNTPLTRAMASSCCRLCCPVNVEKLRPDYVRSNNFAPLQPGSDNIIER